MDDLVGSLGDCRHIDVYDGVHRGYGVDQRNSEGSML